MQLNVATSDKEAKEIEGQYDSIANLLRQRLVQEAKRVCYRMQNKRAPVVYEQRLEELVQALDSLEISWNALIGY